MLKETIDSIVYIKQKMHGANIKECSEGINVCTKEIHNFE